MARQCETLCGFLAEMGYVAFTFDFCGGSAMCGKSDGKTTEMSVRTETKDLKAVIEYVRNLSYTDSEKILLMGCSQGGFVSALVAAKNNFPIEKLVLFYPALCIPDDARAGKMMMAKFDPQNVPDTFRCGLMKLGCCYAMDVMQMDAFAEIKNYAGRVCIVHGTKDKIVDVSYAKRAAEAYKSTMPIGMQDSKRVQLHFIDGGGSAAAGRKTGSTAPATGAGSGPSSWPRSIIARRIRACGAASCSCATWKGGGGKR